MHGLRVRVWGVVFRQRPLDADDEVQGPREGTGLPHL